MIEALTTRDSQKVYMSALRAADKNGQRPTAMILHDPYALHRKWWEPEWRGTIEDTLWTAWDYVLAEVYQTIQDYTDPNSGQWMPFDQSGDVWWDIRSTFSGSQAAIERERKHRGELKGGESLYAVPIFDDSKPRPTLATWAKDMEERKADLRPSERRDARPPTAEELAEIRKRKEAGKLVEGV